MQGVPSRPDSRTSAVTKSSKNVALDGAHARVRPIELADPDPLRDGPRDECGVFGIYAPEPDVARLAYFALYALQHRGQESAAIATAHRGGSILAIRDQGLVSQVFDEHTLRSLVGDMAIGHV